MDAKVTVCPPNRTGQALEILFGSLGHDERQALAATIRQSLSTDPHAREGLLVAGDEEAVRGAVLVQQQPGGTALLWAPLSHPADRELERRLAEAADAYLARSGISMAQAIFATREDPGVDSLESVGFEPLTELVYLIATADSMAPEHETSDLEFEPYQPSQWQRLASLIEATYEETHDCPQLNGVRDTEEVITGYQATGVFDPAKWFLVRRENRDVGVVLLTEHDRSRQWELIYMGVIPPMRQQGIGKAIVDFALRRALANGADSVLLAVDAQNRPAAELYRRSGFQAWSRRLVYWKRYR